MGVAERHRERIGGIAHDPPAARQEDAHHRRDLALVGGAGAHDGALDRLGGVLDHAQAGVRRGQSTTPRACPSLSDEPRLRLITVSSTAATAGPWPATTACRPR